MAAWGSLGWCGSQFFPVLGQCRAGGVMHLRRQYDTYAAAPQMHRSSLARLPPGASPGLCYAFHVFGPNSPGHRFDPSRLLLDPYARELSGTFSYDPLPSFANSPKSCVTDEAFDWGDDAPPSTPWADSVLYEIHVKGATRQHPGFPNHFAEPMPDWLHQPCSSISSDLVLLPSTFCRCTTSLMSDACSTMD